MEWHPLLLSLQVASMATVITAVFGIATGWLLAVKRFPGRELLDVIITAPMVLPPTVLGYYVLVAVGRRSAIGGLFESITGSSLPSSSVEFRLMWVRDRRNRLSASPSLVVQSYSSGTSSCGRFATFPTSAL